MINKLNPLYAQFFQGTRVERILHDSSRKIIYANQDGKELQIETKIIVGADGDHSTVLRSLGARKIDRKHYAGALRQYWKGITELQTDIFELYFPKSFPLGYL